MDDGVVLWTATGGSGSAPVVLCHGGPGLWDHLQPVAEILSAVALIRSVTVTAAPGTMIRGRCTPRCPPFRATVGASGRETVPVRRALRPRARLQLALRAPDRQVMRLTLTARHRKRPRLTRSCAPTCIPRVVVDQ